MLEKQKQGFYFFYKITSAKTFAGHCKKTLKYVFRAKVEQVQKHIFIRIFFCKTILVKKSHKKRIL